jgi:hypothetical protein
MKTCNGLDQNEQMQQTIDAMEAQVRGWKAGGFRRRLVAQQKTRRSPLSHDDAASWFVALAGIATAPWYQNESGGRCAIDRQGIRGPGQRDALAAMLWPGWRQCPVA